MTPQNSIANLAVDTLQERDAFLEDVQEGLRAVPKRIPSKYFYDERGAQLFDRITELDEYYLTRAEISVLAEQGKEIASALPGGSVLIEYGSGASVKTRYLLDRAPGLAAYVPVDASAAMLSIGVSSLAAAYPDLEILPVCADFMNGFRLPAQVASLPRRIGYFPGSTIGNLTPDEATSFLARARALLGDQGGMLIGIDLKKDPRVIEAAYNDHEGVTAEFNLNVLRRINRELGADFRLDGFRHLSFYEPGEGRIEMHLLSLASQNVRVGGKKFSFRAGETIRTEYSYKYDLAGFARIAEAGGFSVSRVWVDSGGLFSVQYLAAE